MNFDKPPTLKEFSYYFNKYLDDIGCANNPEGYIASHKIVGGIRVYDEDDETDFEIVGIDFEQLMGCGCPSDIIIKIKKV